MRPFFIFTLIFTLSAQRSSNGGGGGEMLDLPYFEAVPGGLQPGMAVYVNGTLPRDPIRFGVDFTFAKDEGPDVPFHFNPRFKGLNKHVLNTLKSGIWGKEEKRKNPFRKGEHFELLFIVTDAGYQILLNRKLFCVFRHRIPPRIVQFIKVYGDLELQSLNVTAQPMLRNTIMTSPEGYHLFGSGFPPAGARGFFMVDFACGQHKGADVPLHFNPRFYGNKLVLNTFQAGWWGKEQNHQNPFRKGEHFELIFIVNDAEYQVMTSPAIYHPPVPYTGDIPGGLGAERTITVRGTIPNNAKRFEINFMAGQDIPLHINLRMKPWRAVVRNSFLKGRWGKEERSLTFNPFHPGQYFRLSIHCDNREFKFYANDQPFFNYIHRYVPHKHIRTLEIDGDVTLSYIKY